MPKKNKILEWAEEYIPLLPIIIAVMIIPNVVRIQYYDPGLSGYSWFPNENNLMDMFMYWKNKAMMLLDVLLLAGYVYLAVKRQFSKERIFIPLGIYAFMIVVSTICSVAPHQTWNGFYGMLESVYAVFGYCLICYYTVSIIKSEKQLKIVMAALCAGVLVLTAIGISQFFKADFFMTDLGKDLLFPSIYEGFKDYMKLSFGEGRVYTTLYNPNYVGFYGCLLLPVFMVLTFLAKTKKQAVLCFVLESMIMVCVVGAGNKTAVLLFVPIMIFVALCFGKNYGKKVVITLVATLLVFAACNMLQGEGALFGKVVDRLSQDSGRKKISSKLEMIHLNNEDFTMVYNGETLSVKYIHNQDGSWQIEVKDENGTIIPSYINEEETGFCLKSEKFDGLVFVFGADEDINVGFSVTEGKQSYFIYYSEKDGTYYHTNTKGRRAKIFASETFDSPLFDIMGGLSGRGYIWSKTVPILKETLVIGSGPDTYAFMFPQYDYVSLYQGGYTKSLITKPHNMYLQMGIQTGVISLVSFLIFYIAYFFESLKLYWQKKSSTCANSCGAAIWIGSICYMMSAMLNDSTIGVSIVYWTLLGLGFACNRMVKNSEV